MDNPLQEHHEAAEQAHEGNKRAALLVAVMAAVLALSEQGAKHAEMRVEDSSIAATDTWAQYQAKSTRATMSRDFADLVDALGGQANGDGQADAGASGRIAALRARLRDDQGHYEGGADGKQATAAKADALEHERDHALLRTRAFDNAAAALELGIVLATASVIVGAVMLLWFAAGLGVAGVVFALLAMAAPAIGAI